MVGGTSDLLAEGSMMDKMTETDLWLLNEARRLLQEWIGERVRRPDIRARTAEFIARTKDRD
jgi:hypothetical protein